MLAALALMVALSGSPAWTGYIGEPPTKAARATVYDEKADAKVQIAAAVKAAKAENRRVLIQWGGNWCPWCVRLHALYGSDAAIKKELLYEYDVVYVDAGQPAGKNVELAKSYGAEVDKHGFPFLTVLDSDGKPVANQETEALEVKGADGKSVGVEAGHNPKAVLELLTSNQATHRSAEDVLNAGLAEAKSSGKVAFVHFGAPWCGWCKRLEAWMADPAIAAILAKDFVNVKVDTERTVGGQDMLDTMSKKNSGGIPWTVFLGADRAPIADSNAAKGNIGFPAEEAEIAHFETMLNKARHNMSDSDVRVLIESLKKSAKATAPAGAH